MIMKREGEPTRHFFTYYNRTIPENWNAPALTDYNGTTSYTYGEMAAQMFKLQILLEQAGLERGDKVVICSRNCANWAVALLAIATNRGVIVSIMDAFAPTDIESLTNHSDAKAMFVSQNVWKNIDVQHLENVDLILDTDDFQLLYARTDQQERAFEQYGDVYRERYPRGLQREDVDLPTDNLDDLMIINYTSGTTGAPRGAMLSYRNISANVQYSQEEIPNHAGWTEVCMLPLAHMFGMTIEFLYQVAGGCHVYFLGKTPSPATLLKCYAETKPYMILTVPLVIEKIYKKNLDPMLSKWVIRMFWHTPIIGAILKSRVKSGLRNAFGAKLRYFICGGAAINPIVEKCLMDIHFPLSIGYGMTECAPLIGGNPPKYFKARSGGAPVMNMEVKIDNPNEAGIGEILVKGQNVMMGYYKNPEATKAVFTEDGWMRTGDLGRLDKKKNIYIKGRCKTMFLGASGQNIYPEEIEDKLNNQEAVGESLIVEREGKLIALVFPDETLTKRMTLDEIQAIMKANLEKLNHLIPSYSKVSNIEVQDKPFEKTPKKSIKRFLYK